MKQQRTERFKEKQVLGGGAPRDAGRIAGKGKMNIICRCAVPTNRQESDRWERQRPPGEERALKRLHEKRLRALFG